MLKPCMKILTGALLALCLVGSPAIPPVSDIGLSPLKPEPLPLAEAAAATNEANAPAPLAGQILGRDGTMSLLDEFPGEVKPAVLGASVPRENAANLKTTGWELSVEWNDKLDNGLSYHVKGVLSDYQSTITKYNNPTGLISQYYVDRKIGEIWGYVSNGLFQSDEEVANHADQSYLYGGKWGTGDVKYEDLTDAKRVWSATDRRWLYPIPTNELTLNNNLTQNPGWEQ